MRHLELPAHVRGHDQALLGNERTYTWSARIGLFCVIRKDQVYGGSDVEGSHLAFLTLGCARI